MQIIVVVREPGRLKPDYSLRFDLPEIPQVGSYISVQRPDKPEPYGEDMVVRQVWWRLNHPETDGVVSGKEKVGGLTEIYVECEPAVGPWSSDDWRAMADSAKARGVVLEEFDVARFAVPESEFGSK